MSFDPVNALRGEIRSFGSACFFLVTKNRVLRSRVGVWQSVVVESFTKSGECSLAVLFGNGSLPFAQERLFRL